MKKKKVILLLVVLAAGGLLLTAVTTRIRERRTRERPPTITAIQEAEGIPITAVRPGRRDMPEIILLDGTVEPIRRAVIVSRINRRIEEITVDEGERIARGETAVRLEKAALESALRAARAALEEEERNHQRAEALFASGAVARQALDAARVSREQAEARYRQARETLEDCEISSPLSGLVSRRRMEPGEFSDTGKPILEIVDISAVEVHSPVSELQMGRIRVGQTALVYPHAFPDRVWESTVTTVSPTTRERSRLFTAKIELDNPEEVLRPGMYCRVEVVISRRPDALVLPQETIARDERGEDGVFLIDEDGETVRFRAVETGISRNGLVEIVSGLDEDAAVADAGVHRLADGTRVVVSNQ